MPGLLRGVIGATSDVYQSARGFVSRGPPLVPTAIGRRSIVPKNPGPMRATVQYTPLVASTPGIINHPIQKMGIMSGATQRGSIESATGFVGASAMHRAPSPWHNMGTADISASINRNLSRASAIKPYVGGGKLSDMLSNPKTAMLGGYGLMTAGAVTGFATGGEQHHGAMAGLVGGGAVLGGLHGAKALARSGIGSRYMANRVGQRMGSAATSIARNFSGHDKVWNRRAGMAAGAGLSGFMFSGERTHKRGFNSSRGNSFGR